MKTAMHKLAGFILLGLAILCAPISATEQSSAIKTITKEEILPIYRQQPYPSSGQVLYRAPSFIWPADIKTKTGVNTYTFDYNTRYQLRLSQDPQFETPETFVSAIQEWAFYQYHQALKPGTWYWSYAYVKDGKAEWQPAIAFTVTGKEVDFVSPDFATVFNAIKQAHPRMLATPATLGKVALPASMLAAMGENIDHKLGQRLPELVFNNKKVMTQKRTELNDKQYKMYLRKRTRDNSKNFSVETSDVIKLYAATGKQAYLQEALKRYRHFAAQYPKIIAAGHLMDFTEVAYHAVLSEIFDIAYDALTAQERQQIVAELSHAMAKNYGKYLHKTSHSLHDSHYWQIELRSFFLNALVLLHHTPEAQKWFNYAYELYNVRVPTGGGRDGGWAPGNKYFAANQETLFVIPYLLTRLTGFNYFSKPWYQNVRAYLTYSSPVGHPAGAYGDGAYTASGSLLPLIQAMNSIQPDPFGLLYQQVFAQYGDKAEKSRHKNKLAWYASQPLPIAPKPVAATALAKGMAFRDIGLATMHTQLDNPKQNFMLSMRASPYGVVGHAHAAQNAFNLFYAGEPLFYNTGYYTNWADAHSLQSYRHTRAHNSILVDGIGQNYHPSGYGWLPRFITGEHITYAAGDASRAYSGTIARDQIAKRMQEHGVLPTPEFGFGDAGVKTFRRHSFMLRPGIAVIYDELEANKPVEWTWLVNARSKMLLTKQGELRAEGHKGVAQMHLLASTDYQVSLTDEFVSPPVDWQGKGNKKVNLAASSYHYKAKTNKVAKARFLSIIRVHQQGQATSEVVATKQGFAVDGWLIHAQLDVNKDAAFLMAKDQRGCIAMGHKTIACMGKNFVAEDRLATTLIENENGQYIQRQAIDELPDAAIYY